MLHFLLLELLSRLLQEIVLWFSRRSLLRYFHANDLEEVEHALIEMGRRHGWQRQARELVFGAFARVDVSNSVSRDSMAAYVWLLVVYSVLSNVYDGILALLQIPVTWEILPNILLSIPVGAVVSVFLADVLHRTRASGAAHGLAAWGSLISGYVVLEGQEAFFAPADRGWLIIQLFLPLMGLLFWRDPLNKMLTVTIGHWSKKFLL